MQANLGGIQSECSGYGLHPVTAVFPAGYGHPLILYLEEHGVVTDCQINTREADECLDFNFANANVISKVGCINAKSIIEISSFEVGIKAAKNDRRKGVF